MVDNNDKQDNPILEVNEVAEMLGVNPRSVQRWARRGLFPNAKRKGLGPRSPFLIPLADVEQFERRRKVGALD